MKNRHTPHDLIAYLVCLLLPLPVLWLSPLGPWGNGIPGADSGVYSYVGSGLTKGMMPYRDLFDHKGPLQYLINAAGYTLGGLRGIWLMEWLALGISALFLYRSARLLARSVCALVTVACIIGGLSFLYEYGNYTEEYALAFQSVALYLCGRRYVNGLPFTFASSATIGLCLGAVALLQPNLIALFAALVVVQTVIAIREKQGREWGRFVSGMAVGTVFLLLLAGVWLWLNDTLHDAVQQYLLFNFTYIKVPLAAKIKGGIGTLVQINKTQLLLVSLLSAAVWYFQPRELRRPNRALAGFVALYWLLAFLSNCLSGKGVGHYAVTYLPAAAMPLAAAFRFLAQGLEHLQLRPFAVRAVVTMTSLLLLYPAAWQLHWAAARSHTPQPEYTRIAALTRGGRTLCVLGNDSYLYLATGLKPFSKYHYADPILLYSPELMDDYFSLLDRAKPDYLVIDKVVSDEDPFRFHPAFNKHLQEVLSFYTRVERTGRYTLYRLR